MPKINALFQFLTLTRTNASMISSNLEWAFGTVGCFSGSIVTDFFLNSFLKVIKSLWIFVQKWWNSVFFQNFNTYQDVSDLHIHPSVVNCIHMILWMTRRNHTRKGQIWWFFPNQSEYSLFTALIFFEFGNYNCCAGDKKIWALIGWGKNSENVFPSRICKRRGILLWLFFLWILLCQTKSHTLIMILSINQKQV